MCIPKPQVAAPPPVAVPSLQSAQGIILGGAERGAAQVGRLQLRLGPGGTGADSSAATGAASLSTGPNPVASSPGAAPGAPALPLGSTSQANVSGYNQANNSLRLGNIFVSRQ